MSEKYFVMIIILLLVIPIAIWWCFYTRHIRRLFLRRALQQRIFNKTRQQPFYSSYLIENVADILIKQPISCQKQVLSELDKNDWTTINKILPHTETVLLQINHDLQSALPKLVKAAKQKPACGISVLTLAGIYAITSNFPELKKCLTKLETTKLSAKMQTLAKLYKAKYAMYKGNMSEASSLALQAAKTFKKYGWHFEEAEAYSTLGEVYRISAVYDISDTMFRSALKIYQSVGVSAGMAKIYAMQAMLLTAQERFDEAEQKFGSSLNLYQTLGFINEQAEIINQTALLSLLRTDYTAAQDAACQALSRHRKTGNINGQGYSHELLARIAFKLENYLIALKHTKQAQKFYEKSKNNAAFFETSFLKAECFFALEKYAESEKTCRKLLNLSEKKQTCFHKAFAYSLLGQNLIKRKAYKSAKSCFSKALKLEKQNGRLAASISDYFNLALIARHENNRRDALKNLHTALDIAQQCNDEQLCGFLSCEIKKLDALS